MSSPPPLRHPVPTHPAYIPEPPGSPQGYQRYSSSPGSDSGGHIHNQQHPAQPQAVPAYPSFVPPPTFAGWNFNDSATTQFTMALGSNAVAAGQSYLSSHLSTSSSALKKNFDVSNSYVLHKLSIVLFPWRHRPWSRRLHLVQRGDKDSVEEYESPRTDVNAPDLYIPAMAFVTYILIYAFHTKDPRALGEGASRALLVVFLDFLFVYAGCYFLNVQGSNKALDLLSYTSYKFVSVILLLSSTLLGFGSVWWSYWLIFIYLWAANAFFLLRSLRSLLLPETHASPQPAAYHNPNAPMGAINPNAIPHVAVATGGHPQRRRRISFLFLEAVFCQAVWMALLARV